MDPHILASIPPAQIPAVTATSTVFSSVEANNHVAPSPPPTGASAPIDNAFPTAVTASGLYTVQHASHPPYAEMIYTAISALKEKNGSTKRAIAKYIDQVYKEHLPATHSALLTHHLKRLKNNGLLVMVKNSYMVPRSDQLVSDFTSSPQSQRGRGRPPKPKPQPELQPQVQPHPQPFSQAQAQPIPAQPNADVFAALGLGDEPALEVKKKGPGRPPKSPATGMGQVGPAVRKGRPPGSGRSRAPKRAGRPPKPKSVSAISNGLKRRPGRPPKNQYNPTVIPFAAPASGTAPAPIAASAAELASTLTVSPALTTATASVASPRPRGRPRKNAAAVTALAPAAAVPVVGAGRGRGRGRGRGPGRGRGRWVYPVMKQGQPLKISSRRPVGRPRKGTAAPTLQNVASEELRRKLEYFQSKVKEALGVIKPHFNHESPVTAIAAIQELEILATLDLDAPLRDEMQQPQQLPLPQLPSQQQPAPQQQQLPQQQMYHQQLPQVQLQPQPLHQYQPQAPGLS